MRKAAFAYWDTRIAPVFDNARQLYLVEAGTNGLTAETREVLANDLPAQKALRLAELAVDTLVCGAISRSLHEMVSAYGIRVIPFVTGEMDEIIEAWHMGKLHEDTFAMPGCRQQRRSLHQCIRQRRGHHF